MSVRAPVLAGTRAALAAVHVGHVSPGPAPRTVRVLPRVRQLHLRQRNVREEAHRAAELARLVRSSVLRVAGVGHPVVRHGQPRVTTGHLVT